MKARTAHFSAASAWRIQAFAGLAGADGQTVRSVPSQLRFFGGITTDGEHPEDFYHRRNQNPGQVEHKIPTRRASDTQLIPHRSR